MTIARRRSPVQPGRSRRCGIGGSQLPSDGITGAVRSYWARCGSLRATSLSVGHAREPSPRRCVWLTAPPVPHDERAVLSRTVRVDTPDPARTPVSPGLPRRWPTPAPSPRPRDLATPPRDIGASRRCNLRGASRVSEANHSHRASGEEPETHGQTQSPEAESSATRRDPAPPRQPPADAGATEPAEPRALAPKHIDGPSPERPSARAPERPDRIIPAGSFAC